MVFSMRKFIGNSVVLAATWCGSSLIAALHSLPAYSAEPDFSAKWVKATQEVLAVDFCGRFSCPDGYRRVRFFISNKSVSELTVNGSPAEFSPAPEFSDVRRTDGLHADVTRQSHHGENEIRFSCTSKSKTPDFILRGEVIDANGRTNGFFSSSKSFSAA